MKIGLHSHSRRHAFANQKGYDIHKFLKEAAEGGFEAVEVMTGKAGDPPSHIGTDDEEELQELCLEAAGLGVPIVCYSTYNDFSFTPNEKWRKANVEYILHWISLAGATDVPNLRYLTGYTPADEPMEKLEELVIRETLRCVKAAEEHGVNLALENHSKVFMYADDILRLKKEAESQRLTTCPDPTNGFTCLKEPDNAAEAERMYENLEKLAPFATNAHMKVMDGNLTGIDPERALQILHRHGFTGAIHLELCDAEADFSVLVQARERLEQARENVLGRVPA